MGDRSRSSRSISSVSWTSPRVVSASWRRAAPGSRPRAGRRAASLLHRQAAGL